MSRYSILTEDENLEVVAGFDEGFEAYFLTITDVRTCTDEAESYLFHNIDDHEGVGMTLEQVEATLARFGMRLPSDLREQLRQDASIAPGGILMAANRSANLPSNSNAEPIPNAGRERASVNVLSWQPF